MTEKDSYVPLKIQPLVKTALKFTRLINRIFFYFIEGKEKESANFKLNLQTINILGYWRHLKL